MNRATSSLFRGWLVGISLAAAGAIWVFQPAIAGGQGVIDGTPILHEETKLLASDGTTFDFFGVSVAVTGDRMVVGSYHDDDLGEASGSAYVFERDEAGGWTEVAKLLASDGAANDNFGISATVAGDTVVVGAFQDGDLGFYSGSAYVFERDEGGRWTEVAKLLASDGAAEDVFGVSVAIARTTVVVGARGHDELGSDDSGSAYLFERSEAGTWFEAAKLRAPDRAEGDQFGQSVAIAGDTVVVGAWKDDDLGTDSGSAYVFERDEAGTWTEAAKLLASDGAAGDWFGLSVGIAGSTVVVGAELDDDSGTSSGSAHVFERDEAGTWRQVAKLLASDGAPRDNFGHRVAVSGETVVVAADGDDDLGENSGSAYVFERDEAGGWAQLAKLLASDGAADDRFGISVAAAGDTVLAGAYRDDDLGTSSGSAYVFSVEGCILELRVDPPVVRPGDELQVRVYLHHRRRQTVTVPLALWVEDEAGGIVVERTTPALTFHPGDTRRLERTVVIPADAAPGDYRVLVGVDQMRQGPAGASRRFRVLD